MADIEVHRERHDYVVFDRERVGAFNPTWFDAACWEAEGTVVHSTKGRGSVLRRSFGGESWVLRHYHRGGLVASVIDDHYLWTGLERTRAFREWRLLHDLHGRGLPVPEPLAARVERSGPIYQCDILISYLPATRTLTSHLYDGRLAEARWAKLGQMLKRFHDHGVDHPDLTAHNILLDAEARFYLVDFDNASLKPPGPWQARGMRRLERSLRKVALETGTDFDTPGWQALCSAYDRPAQCNLDSKG